VRSPGLLELQCICLPAGRQVAPSSTASQAVERGPMGQQTVVRLDLPAARVQMLHRPGKRQPGGERLKGSPVVDEELYPAAFLPAVNAGGGGHPQGSAADSGQLLLKQKVREGATIDPGCADPFERAIRPPAYADI